MMPFFFEQVLPTYPCVQPSESVAYRTSLAKYLDNLRHHPTSSSNTQILKGKGSDMAWWWKDVTIRKSLLEECVGEKYVYNAPPFPNLGYG